MKKINKLFICAGLFISAMSGLFAQNITTASAYFKTISEYYATLKDYECDFDLKIEKNKYDGKISYKAPYLLRMDYNTPKNQTICYTGETLTIYLPNEDAVLVQAISGDTGVAAATTGQGLSLLSRYYTVQYKTGQNAVPLDEDSEEMVVKFVLQKKNATETFRTIELSINENTKLIRRLEAVTSKGETFLFNFYDYKTNEGISDQRFLYNPPSSANDFDNFLFSE